MGNFRLLKVKRGIAATNTLKPQHSLTTPLLCECAEVENPARKGTTNSSLLYSTQVITETVCTIAYYPSEDNRTS